MSNAVSLAPLAPLAPMLSAERVEVRRGKRLVLSVDHLDVQPGETLAIIGPNGAGKSTLLQALAILLPSTGEISIAGDVVTPANAARLRRRMAVVFQEPLLLDTSVEDNVAIGLRLRGVGRVERASRVARWMAAFGVDHLAKRSARSISGGEAQRASLARAFAMEPEVLFLDEPFSALDAPTRAALASDLQAILRETRTTTVMVTHDQDEAFAFGDRLGVLIGGVLRQVGCPDDVLGTPSDPEVASFVGVETIVPGVVVSQQGGLAEVEMGAHRVRVASALGSGTPVLFCLRPEDASLGLRTDGPGCGTSSQIPGRIASAAPWGGRVRVEVDCGFTVVVSVSRRTVTVTELDLLPGESAVVWFEPAVAHLIPHDPESVS
jgi:ABC-type sugar transport system ATPase subunit